MDFKEENKFLVVTDYSVSKETFALLYNKEYDLLKTHPFPELEILPKYYESEDYISHTDGKRTLFEKLYHFVKRRAIKKKVNLINSYHKQKGLLLDVGCGTGDFLVEAQKQGWNTTGFEPSQTAKKLANSKNVATIDDLDKLTPHSFDVITLWHVLEHVPDLEAYIKKLKKLLKKEGTLLVAVPNYKSYDAIYYKRHWAAFDVPRHLWHFSKKSIKRLFSDVDMNLDCVLPMWFDSFYVSMLSEKHKKGKINFFNAILIGFYSNCIGLIKKEFSSHIYVLKNKK